MPANRPTMAMAITVEATIISSSVNPRLLALTLFRSLCFQAFHARKSGHGIEPHDAAPAVVVRKLDGDPRHRAPRHKQPPADAFRIHQNLRRDSLHHNSVRQGEFSRRSDRK